MSWTGVQKKDRHSTDWPVIRGDGLSKRSEVARQGALARRDGEALSLNEGFVYLRVAKRLQFQVVFGERNAAAIRGHFCTLGRIA